MDRLIAFQLDEDKIKTLDALAISMDRDRSYLLNEAVANYLDVKQWQLNEIRSALAEADSGDFATDDEVKTAFAAFKAPS